MPLLRNPNRPGIGCFDFAIWDELSGWMTDRGLLEAPVSSSDAVKNEYVPSC